jgi:hypothetical protein
MIRLLHGIPPTEPVVAALRPEAQQSPPARLPLARLVLFVASCNGGVMDGMLAATRAGSDALLAIRLQGSGAEGN